MTIREMPREVTATELQRDYARVIRDAEYGHPTTVTRSGKPVAVVAHPSVVNCPAPEQWESAAVAFNTAITNPQGEYRQAILALGDLLRTWRGFPLEGQA